MGVRVVSKGDITQVFTPNGTEIKGITQMVIILTPGKPPKASIDVLVGSREGVDNLAAEFNPGVAPYDDDDWGEADNDEYDDSTVIDVVVEQ